MTRVVIYARYSTDLQNQQSIDDQVWLRRPRGAEQEKREGHKRTGSGTASQDTIKDRNHSGSKIKIKPGRIVKTGCLHPAGPWQMAP